MVKIGPQFPECRGDSKMFIGSGGISFVGSSTVGGIALFRYKIVLVPDLNAACLLLTYHLYIYVCRFTLPLLLERFR